MKLFFKISLAIILLLLITLTGAVLLFNPNDYKAEIITLFKDKTGRDLSIPGDISLSVFPWIGIELGAIEVGNAHGFGKQPFAKMSHLQVRAKFWPLFKKRLEADTLVIEGLTLNLEKNAQGVSNWDDLSQAGKTGGMPQAEKPKPETSSVNSATALAAFAINGIELSKSQLNWNDQVQKQKILIKDIQLKVGQLLPDSRIPVDTQFHFQQKDLDAKIAFTSQVIFSKNFKQFSFYDTQLKTDLKLAALKKMQSPQLRSALIQLDLEKQTASSKQLSLSANNITLDSQFSAQHILSRPQFNAQLKIKPFNPKVAAENLDITFPELTDDKALSQLSAQFKLAGSLEKIDLSSLEVKLDDTQLNGNASINLTPLNSKVNLSVNTINLDRYLPKPAGENKTGKDSANNTAEAALIPIALLSTINTHADIKVDAFQIMKTHWSKLHLIVKAKSHANQGTVEIKPLRVAGYGSTINSAINLQVKNNTAMIAGDINIENLKSGQLLKDFMGIEKLKGLASVKANISSQGVKLTQLKQYLNGNVKLSLHDGIITGFDLKYQRDSLDAKLKGKTVPPAPVPAQTEFAELTATAAIKNGIVTNNDLRAATPFTRIAGHGTVNIPKEQLNYVVSAKFISEAEVKNQVAYEKINAIPLDTIITGTFSKPEFKIDFQKAIEQIAKKELKVQERKLKEKAKTQINQQLEQKKKELEKKVGNELKKLFKF